MTCFHQMTRNGIIYRKKSCWYCISRFSIFLKAKHLEIMIFSANMALDLIEILPIFHLLKSSVKKSDSNYSIPKVNPKYKMNLRMRKENKWQTVQQSIVFIPERIIWLHLTSLSQTVKSLYFRPGSFLSIEKGGYKIPINKRLLLYT